MLSEALAEGSHSARAKAVALPIAERFLHLARYLSILSLRGRCQSSISDMAGCGVTYYPMARDAFDRRQGPLGTTFMVADVVSLFERCLFGIAGLGGKRKPQHWQMANRIALGIVL